MDPSVCGKQTSAVAYGLKNPTLALVNSDVYVWQYTSGRTEQLVWESYTDNTCTFRIEQSSRAPTACTCQWTNCGAALTDVFLLYVDCSSYENGPSPTLVSMGSELRRAASWKACR